MAPPSRPPSRCAADAAGRAQAEYDRIVGSAAADVQVARQRAVDEAAATLGEIVIDVVDQDHRPRGRRGVAPRAHRRGDRRAQRGVAEGCRSRPHERLAHGLEAAVLGELDDASAGGRRRARRSSSRRARRGPRPARRADRHRDRRAAAPRIRRRPARQQGLRTDGASRGLRGDPRPPRTSRLAFTEVARCAGVLALDGGARRAPLSGPRRAPASVVTRRRSSRTCRSRPSRGPRTNCSPGRAPSSRRRAARTCSPTATCRPRPRAVVQDLLGDTRERDHGGSPRYAVVGGRARDLVGRSTGWSTASPRSGAGASRASARPGRVDDAREQAWPASIEHSDRRGPSSSRSPRRRTCSAA